VFWTKYQGEPFPDVAGAVHEEIEAWKKKSSEMSSNDDSAIAPGIAAALNALPEMTEKKRSIDMHTNIATALMNEIKARELDRYYQMEDNFSSQSLSTSISELEKLLKDPQRGTVMDKTRALLILYLTKPSITPAQLEPLVEALSAAGGDTAAFAYLRYLSSIRSMAMPSVTSNPTPSAPSGTSLMGGATAGMKMLDAFAKSATAAGEGLLAAGMNNIKNIVQSKKELLICQILDGLMEQRPGGPAESYLYLDPKAPASGAGPRIRSPFRKAITFVVGGGNYVELQSLQEWAQTSGRQVTYGSTDMVSPIQFVEELTQLGLHHAGGARG